MRQAQLSTVRRTESLTTRTYRELREALMQRVIAPGERLVETDLAHQLGVSRTPVREALARLVSDGMADALPSGGVVVRDIRKELADIYGLRQVLEGYAARLAAQRIQPPELKRLQEISTQIPGVWTTGRDRVAPRSRNELGGERVWRGCWAEIRLRWRLCAGVSCPCA